jgi:hypothetical protein
MTTIKFYCITLDSRADRKHKISTEFRRLNIPIEWWIVKRHPMGSKYGCFESHVNIWEKNDADIAVIFEDDMEFHGRAVDFWKIINEAVDLSLKYSTVHLGHIACYIKRQISKNFYEGKFITTCCYLGRKEKLIQLAPTVKHFYGNHIDTVISQVSLQIGLLPYKFSQDFTDSNNSWTKDIPIISQWTDVDRNIRSIINKDPYHLLRHPSFITGGAIKFVLVLGTLQQLLPRILYNSGTEFTDRRITNNYLDTKLIE